MRNRILYLTRNTIPYVKELHPLTHSVAGCLLMQQLDYWFERYPKSFYKFMEPSNHPQYKPSESWCEELGISAPEFRTAFDKIGVRYKSKSDFDKTKDKFQGKFYCSCFDRRSNLTFYFRNHALLDDALDSLLRDKKNSDTSPSGNEKKSPNLNVSACFTNKFIPSIDSVFTGNKESTFTGNEESVFPVNTDSAFTGNKENQVTEMLNLHSQEMKEAHSLSTETTGTETTQKPQLQLQKVNLQPNPKLDANHSVSGGGFNFDLVFPSSLENKDREKIENLLVTCSEQFHQPILDEIQGAINAQTIQKGPVPFCRALVSACKLGKFKANLGLAVLATRRASNQDSGSTQVSEQAREHTDRPSLLDRNALSGLIFPKTSEDLLCAFEVLIETALPLRRQPLLDELIGRMSTGTVKNPLSYLRSLITKDNERNGTLLLEWADKIKAKRMSQINTIQPPKLSITPREEGRRLLKQIIAQSKQTQHG